MYLLRLYSVLVLVSTKCLFAQNDHLSPSRFYEDTSVYEYSCSVVFSRPMHFDCACVNGLWLLYNSCEDNQNVTIAGENERCTMIPDMLVSKAIQLSKSPDELALLDSEGSVRSLQPDQVNDLYIDNSMTLITGSEWTLVEASGLRICLSPGEPNSYCYFSNKADSDWTLLNIELGCEYFDFFLDPEKCQPVEKGGVDNDICEDDLAKKRVKRDAGQEGQQGRVFFGAPGQTPVASNGSGNSTVPVTSGNVTLWLPVDDEDYFNVTSANKTEEIESIATEIWTSIDIKLDMLLGIEKPKPRSNDDGKAQTGRGRSIEDSISKVVSGLNITYTNPVYEFLDICKRIMQKTCPPYYVKPEFLDLAVSSFIRLQQIHFKFPETTFRPSAFRRVLGSLQLCELLSTPFNFTKADCDGKVSGGFSAFAQIIELTISDEWTPPDRDPIVETVWKVFFNAHSACFSYFNKTFNDHHRFTTWMIPLFQNQMNDLWLHGKTTKNSLSGLFGNQVEVQGNLAYCAASTRLESKYPWDLPRPARVPRFGKPLNFTAHGRKKRDVDSYSIYDMAASASCMDSKKPLVCPIHAKSFIN